MIGKNQSTQKNKNCLYCILIFIFLILSDVPSYGFLNNKQHPDERNQSINNQIIDFSKEIVTSDQYSTKALIVWSFGILCKNALALLGGILFTLGYLLGKIKKIFINLLF